MAFYFEVRDSKLSNFSGDWAAIETYRYPLYDLYRSKRYETVSAMLKDVKAFMKREKTCAIPIFLENGYLLSKSDLLFSLLMHDSLPCGCPSIEVCERGGCVRRTLRTNNLF